MTILFFLCYSRELNVIRKRYRAEEIQELFLRKKSSLRFNSRQKKFVTVIEQKHQIYRTSSQAVEKSNSKFAWKIKVKKWILSLVDGLCSRNPQVQGLGKKSILNYDIKKWKLFSNLIKTRRSNRYQIIVRNYTKKVSSLLPIAPVTGFSYSDRNKNSPLVRRFDEVLGQEVELIITGKRDRDCI